MEISWSDWGRALGSCKELKEVGYVAYQMEPLCPSPEEWDKFCEEVLNLGWPDGMAEESAEFARNPKQVQIAMLDNYFVEAVRLVLGDADRSMPAVAWAAFNKHTYPGHADECATVRFLTWAGFDVSEPDGDGQTPLHFMAATKVSPGSHPRAVAILLEAGANPNAQRTGGDSPLTCLFGNVQWTAEAHESAWLLLRAGADPHQPSGDGATPFSVLVACQKENPTGGRAQIIAQIEAGVIAGAMKVSLKGGSLRKPPL